MRDFLEVMELGSVLEPAPARDTADMAWAAHPKFEGVSLKHLLKGDQTEGRFSLHLVKVEPGKEIGDHLHQNQVELHQVIAGRGVCDMAGKMLDYTPGTLALMPSDVPHSIRAGQEGITLQAVFAPPLL